VGEREDIIEQVVAELNLTLDMEIPKDYVVLSFWVDTSYKKKFDELQLRSKQDFGKKAKEVLYLLINRAWEKI